MENITNNKPPRLLVHMCCGPCSIIPLKSVLGGWDVWGFFFNPNIHPYGEFRKRLEAVKQLAGYLSINVIYNEEYRPTRFINEMKASLCPDDSGEVRYPAFGDRCVYCYRVRLEETARAAKENGFEFFTSSLLYSKYQNHGNIKEAGIGFALKYGVEFYYEDFRPGWQAGIDESKEMGLYRQKYCGCIYSRIERYSKKKKQQVNT